MKHLACLFFTAIIVSCFSCSNQAPKPIGYFRIDLNQPEYKVFTDSTGQFLFNIPEKAQIEMIPDTVNEEWFNIVYPLLNAKIYCSFLSVTSRSNLAEMTEANRKFVYVHVPKADGISERMYSVPKNQVYALVYDIKGNVATPLQFVITDSTHYIFRGSLYFEDSTPNQDSTAPVKAYIGNDIEEMIRSFQYLKKK